MLCLDVIRRIIQYFDSAHKTYPGGARRTLIRRCLGRRPVAPWEPSLVVCEQFGDNCRKSSLLPATLDCRWRGGSVTAEKSSPSNAPRAGRYLVCAFRNYFKRQRLHHRDCHSMERGRGRAERGTRTTLRSGGRRQQRRHVAEQPTHVERHGSQLGRSRGMGASPAGEIERVVKPACCC